MGKKRTKRNYKDSLFRMIFREKKELLNLYNAIKAAGNADIIGVGFDKSDAILNLIDDGYLLCTMAQNPDVMGSEGVKAAVKAINGEELGGEVTDTGVSVITKDSDK